MAASKQIEVVNERGQWGCHMYGWQQAHIVGAVDEHGRRGRSIIYGQRQ